MGELEPPPYPPPLATLLGVLQFVPPALEILAERRTKIFYIAFWPLISRLELSLNAN